MLQGKEQYICRTEDCFYSYNWKKKVETNRTEQINDEASNPIVCLCP